MRSTASSVGPNAGPELLGLLRTADVKRNKKGRLVAPFWFSMLSQRLEIAS